MHLASAIQASTQTDILIGWSVADRYELEELVGRGRKSVVYRARDTAEGGGLVAVKLLEGSCSDDEAGIALGASSLGHPGIVRMFHIGREEEDVPCLVTEFLHGRTVAQLQRTEQISEEEALRIAVAAAEAVAAAHAAGLVHGALAASKIVVTEGGRVRVRDFGRGASSRGSPAGDASALVALLLELVTPPDGVDAISDPTARLRSGHGFEALGPVLRRALERGPRLRDAGELVALLSKLTDGLGPTDPSSDPSLLEPVSSVSVRTLIGRTIADRYRVDGVLGRGAMSIVCRARHLALGSDVAIKVLAPASADVMDDAIHDRFQFEAELLSGLRHPNVVAVFDLGATEDGLRYMVMELLEGETLASLLGRGPVSPEVAVGIASEAAEALAVLHERGLIHRDVKPSNLFVARDPNGVETIKLMDLGLARALHPPAVSPPPDGRTRDEGPRRRLKTRDGLVLGTGAYMSPELIQGLPIDPRSDIYALGVVTYRMLTGTLPFGGKDLPRLLARHMCEPVEPLRQRAPDAGISEALERVVLRALAKDPDHRPRTARAFAAELVEALDGDPPVCRASVQDAGEATLLLPRRRVAGKVATAVVLLAAALALYAVSGPLRANRDEPAKSGGGPPPSVVLHPLPGPPPESVAKAAGLPEERRPASIALTPGGGRSATHAGRPAPRRAIFRASDDLKHPP